MARLLSEVVRKEQSADKTVRAYYQVTEGQGNLEADSLDAFLRAVVDGRNGECDYCDVSHDDQHLTIEAEAELTNQLSRRDAVAFYLDAVSLTCEHCPAKGPGVPAPYRGGIGESIRRNGHSLDPDWGKSPDKVGWDSSDDAGTDAGSQQGRSQLDGSTGGGDLSTGATHDIDEQSAVAEATDRDDVVVRDDGVPIYPDEGRIAFDLMDTDQLGGSANRAISRSRSSSASSRVNRVSQSPVFTVIGNTLNEIRAIVLGVLIGFLFPGWLVIALGIRFCDEHRNTLAGLAVVAGFGIAGAVFVIPDWPVSGIGGWVTIPTQPSDIGPYGVASVVGGAYVTGLWAAWEFQPGTAVPDGNPSDVSGYRESLLRRLVLITVVAVVLLLFAAGSHLLSVSVEESALGIAGLAVATGCYVATGITAHRTLVATGAAMPTIFGVNIAVIRALGHVLVIICPWLWVNSTTLTGRVVTILLPVVYYAGVYGLTRQ